MTTIVRIDDLGTTTITNATDGQMKKMLDRLTIGLIQNLLMVTFEHISANQEFYVLDGITIPKKVDADHEIKSDEMLDIVKASLEVVSAYLSNNASAGNFLRRFSDKNKMDLLIFAEYIFGGMEGIRQDRLMREWKRQTDAGDNMREEILKLISNIKKTLI